MGKESTPSLNKCFDINVDINNEMNIRIIN